MSDNFILLAIDQFKKESLLENNDVIVPVFRGMSRREVIRKLGLASAIALPLISVIAVPSTAPAQASCVPESAGCNPMYGSPCCPNLQCRSITIYAPTRYGQPFVIN